MAEYKSRILRRIELNEWWKKVCKEHNICGAQQPCKDAIGREDMLDAIGHGTTYTSEELQRIIKGLPPVNPQPKMDFSELKRRILMEVDGGTDDRMLRYCDVCDRISDSIDKYQAESEDKYV